MLTCVLAELEDVRYVIGDSYPEYEVRRLNRGKSVKQGDEVEFMWVE
jgi:hypothetical protein